MSRCKLGQDDQRLHLRTYATGRRFQQSDLDATTRDALDRESEDEGAEVLIDTAARESCLAAN